MNIFTISVAICLFNGEKYLQEQLDSISNQSRLPDELIVCDDNSTDRTLSIVEKYSESTPFPVRIVRNKTNIGSTRNFEKVICLCEGDIISLSDQDDVWHYDKLKLIEEVFNSSTQVGVIFSNGNIVNEDLSPLGYTLWDKYYFGKRRKRMFSNGKALQVLLKNNVVTGATMAFRSSLRDKLLPLSPLWVHDSWIALLSSIISDIKFIDKELIEYRQHEDQQIGGIKNNMIEQMAISKSVKDYNVQIRQYEKIIEHINKYKYELRHYSVSKISDKIMHLNNRQDMYKCNVMLRIVKCINELVSGRYHKYSNGYRSFIKDILTTYG